MVALQHNKVQNFNHLIGKEKKSLYHERKPTSFLIDYPHRNTGALRAKDEMILVNSLCWKVPLLHLVIKNVQIDALANLAPE